MLCCEMRKERNAENGSKMLENLKIRKNFVLSEPLMLPMNRHWKKLFRKII